MKIESLTKTKYLIGLRCEKALFLESNRNFKKGEDQTKVYKSDLYLGSLLNYVSGKLARNLFPDGELVECISVKEGIKKQMT